MTVDIFEMDVQAGWFMHSASALTSLSLYICTNKQQTFMLLQYLMGIYCTHYITYITCTS